jgi:transposase-like protein
VQDVSTRKVRAVLCGHGFGAGTVSAATKQPDVGLERVMNRPLTEEYPCLILDARHERVLENGVVRPRAVLVLRWQAKHARLCLWVESAIEETFVFQRRPREHHKHLKSTSLLERLNQEFKRRTHIARIFTDEARRPRLIRAIAVKQHEEWKDGSAA